MRFVVDVAVKDGAVTTLDEQLAVADALLDVLCAAEYDALDDVIESVDSCDPIAEDAIAYYAERGKEALPLVPREAAD